MENMEILIVSAAMLAAFFMGSWVTYRAHDGKSPAPQMKIKKHKVRPPKEDDDEWP